MKISVDAEELADNDALEQAAEKYHGDYGVSKQELIDRMKAEPQLSLYISEDDAIRWGILDRPMELF